MSWVIFTILATILQSFRNLEQKSLNKRLDALTVSWSRFIIPLPFAIIVVILTFYQFDNKFIFYCFVAGLFQIAGNVFLLQTFKARNFSIGIAFYKTEVLQSYLIGLLFFNTLISKSDLISILVATIGVILISGNFTAGYKNLAKSFYNQSSLYGLLTGLSFSISAFNLKFASDKLYNLQYSPIKTALIVLMWIICFQNIFFVIVKFCQRTLIRDFKSIISLENKYTFLKTSILSFCGSFCWFIAFGLGEVVYVKAVGQIEIVIAILISFLLLKEKLKKIEIIGITLTSSGILWLIFNQN
ncbi:MAG: EamA family transporter [Rickettsiales bacterium]|nr:EamA family transporter [Rickettsiales bacterium]